MRYLKFLALLGAVAACDSSTDIGASVDGSLNFAVVGQPGLLGTSRHENPMSVGGHAIALSSVQLRASEVELESDGESESKFEWKGGDFSVNLPVNGNVAVTAFNRAIPEGSYDELELRIESARIQGTFDGKPFDITVNVNEDLELEFDFPIVVGGDGATNITIGVIVESWFRTSTGAVIDPTNFNSTIESQLRARIRASLDAFEDEDRDGDR